ncbi:MAG: chemotaxis protein CheC [Candidatus Thermoplasmatota archaeon]
MADIAQLNEIQLDALQETGNIGCSHAATAVSHMISKPITISVPDIKIKKIDELRETLKTYAGEHEKVVGVYLELTNEFLGSILFIFPYSSALSLADLLLSQEIGTTKELDEMSQSAIMEVGNVVVSAYTNALGKFLNATIMLSPPQLTCDVPDGVLDNITKNLGSDTTHALVFHTSFNEENNLFKSYFILLPSPRSLDILLEKLTSCITENQDAETKRYLDTLKNNAE